MQIFDIALCHRTGERGRHRLRIEGEDPAFGALPLDDRQGVVPGHVEQRHLLVIADLPARILAVANDDRAVILIQIRSDQIRSAQRRPVISDRRMAVAMANSQMSTMGMTMRGFDCQYWYAKGGNCP